MTAATKISACVDCATPIIGDRLHCAACHVRHPDDLIAGEIVDDVVTIPRQLPAKPLSLWQALAAWLVIAQMFAVVALLVFLARRGCQ